MNTPSDNPYLQAAPPSFRVLESLTERQARVEIEQLSAAIRWHDHLYYGLDKPGIADGLYDRLMTRLVDLENAFPQLIRRDSPSQRVGGVVAASLAEIEHLAPLLSLDSSVDAERVAEFDVRARKALDVDSLTYVAEPKFDGLSIEVVFSEGRYLRAATRGDGYRGEDVTENVRTIRSVPMLLQGEPVEMPRLLAVRGEVLMPVAGFQAMNRARLERGEEPFANPRNAAAGAIRQLDSAIAASRPLDLFFYDLLWVEGVTAPQTHWDTLSWLRRLGLKVTDRLARCEGIGEAIDYHARIGHERDELPFEIDGVVIKVDRRDHQEALGTRSRNPRWAFAHKFAPREEVTRIDDIAIQVGRTGILAPVALLVPVEVGGVTISRASLHNYEQVRDKDIRPGDSVRVHRAGDVIPYVVGRVDERPDAERPSAFRMPATCPVCGSHVEADGAYFVCTGGIVCPAQLNGAVEHWGSRHALDIEGLGVKTVRQLTEAGLVRDSVADLYRIGEQDLLELDHFGQIKASNLIAALEASKETTLARFIYALGIRHVGEHVAEVLAREFGALQPLIDADEQRLLSVHEVGPQVSHNVREFFAEARNGEVVRQLMELGMKPRAERRGEQVFAGEKFVITGTLASMGRGRVAELLDNLGARVTTSVSAKTDYVVAGESPGSKTTKAARLGVTIINEKQLIDLLRERGVVIDEMEE